MSIGQNKPTGDSRRRVGWNLGFSAVLVLGVWAPAAPGITEEKQALTTTVGAAGEYPNAAEERESLPTAVEAGERLIARNHFRPRRTDRVHRGSSTAGTGSGAVIFGRHRTPVIFKHAVPGKLVSPDISAYRYSNRIRPPDFETGRVDTSDRTDRAFTGVPARPSRTGRGHRLDGRSHHRGSKGLRGQRRDGFRRW